MIGPLFGLPLIGRYVRTPAVLLTLFYGLAVCGWLHARDPRRARGCWMWIGDRLRRAVDRLPALARGDARATSSDRIDRDGALYADLRDGRPRPGGARRAVEALRRHASPPPTTGRSRTCAAGSAPRRARVGTTSRAAQPAARTCCCCRATSRAMRRFYQRRTSRAAAGAARLAARSTATRSGACVAARRRAAQTSSSVTASWPTSRNSV